MKIFGIVNFWLPFLSGYMLMGVLDALLFGRQVWIVALYVVGFTVDIGTYVFMFKYGQDKE